MLGPEFKALASPDAVGGDMTFSYSTGFRLQCLFVSIFFSSSVNDLGGQIFLTFFFVVASQ